MYRFAFLLLFTTLFTRQAYAEESRSIETFRLADTAGKLHTRDEWTDKSAVVFLFLAKECPAVNGYAATMERIATDYSKRRVLVYGIHCDPDVTAEAAQQHAKEFGLSFPILMDADQTVSRQIGVTRTATAVVIDRNGQVLYRGRIDDRYPAPGKRRDEARTHELADALNFVLAGKKPAIRETEVVGCPLPRIRTSRIGETK
jgi:peroxiredoxin